VHPDNFHNRGGACAGTVRGDAAFGPHDRLTASVQMGRARFDVPHGAVQEAAGQGQRQTLRQRAQRASWQRVWSGAAVSHVAGSHRRIDAQLADTPAATPLFVESDRRHDRVGVVASLTVERGSHTLKTGAEAARLVIDEYFTFAVTDDDLCEDAGLSDAATAFSPARPFVFAGDVAQHAQESDDDGGGADLAPERQHAYEVGVEHVMGTTGRVSAAAWRRDVRNYTDPNVFFGTTIVFPNSVVTGRAQGLDLRVDVTGIRGWSSFLTYTLSKVEQTGPVNGGLFLEDEIGEIDAGTTVTPDHDQRHAAAAGLTFAPATRRILATAIARYESGTPLDLGDLDDDDAEELGERPGAERVDLARPGAATPGGRPGGDHAAGTSGAARDVGACERAERVQLRQRVQRHPLWRAAHVSDGRAGVVD